MEGWRRHDADGEATLLAPSRASRRFERPLVLREQGARIVEEDASGFGQLDPTRLAQEELGVELAFDGFDQLAKRRLLHAETFGRPRNVPFLGHHDETAEVSKLQT